MIFSLIKYQLLNQKAGNKKETGDRRHCGCRHQTGPGDRGVFGVLMCLVSNTPATAGCLLDP